MSYNPTPDWAHVAISVGILAESCPDCGAHIGKVLREAITRRNTATHSYPAHVPPSVEIDCPKCGETLIQELAVEVRPRGYIRRTNNDKKSE